MPMLIHKKYVFKMVISVLKVKCFRFFYLLKENRIYGDKCILVDVVRNYDDTDNTHIEDSINIFNAEKLVKIVVVAVVVDVYIGLKLMNQYYYY